jgi:hypothetical protein
MSQASSQTAPDIGSLLTGAVAGGSITSGTIQALNIPVVGGAIAAGFGISMDKIKSPETILEAILIDDSSSIKEYGNVGLVREAVNDIILPALAECRNAEAILVQLRLMNGHRRKPDDNVICGFMPVKQAPKLDKDNYNERYFGNTPLYEQFTYLLLSAVAKQEEANQSGITCRSISLAITDGENVGGNSYTARDVARVVKDMGKQEGQHIVAGFGIPGNNRVDFRDIFTEMGIPANWILEPKQGATPEETKKNIRDAFMLFSQKSSQAAQGGATGFSNVAQQGFSVAGGGFAT